VLGRIEECLLFLREILKARQPDVLCFAQTLIVVLHQGAMFSLTHFVHGLFRRLHHVKSIVHNLVFRQRNDELRGFHRRSTHVLRDCFGRLNLKVSKLRKTGTSAVCVVAIAESFDRAVVQVVEERDVVLPA